MPDSKLESLSKKNQSRRTFMKASGSTLVGAGVHAAGASALLSKQASAAAGAPPAAEDLVIGPQPTPIQITINGTPQEVRVTPDTTLAELLRDQLNMTGTKIVCNRGACSACSVTLNDEQVCSCMTLAVDAEGADVRTVEGLANSFTLNKVQQAFVRNDAQQCGMCTPGFVQNATALLEANPKPTLDDVKTALSGNLCRCGAYPKIFAAVMDASGQAPADDGDNVIVRQS